jgi:FkbM family methyltransferase
VQRRLHGWSGLERRLPWSLWRLFCGVNAAAYVNALGRRDKRVRFFVQIGSNDGVHYDPLHAAVREYGWNGVLVEPLRPVFDRLVANYAGVPGLSFANVAVDREDGTTTIFTIDARADDPPWAGFIASLDRDVLLRHRSAIPDLGERIHPTEVETLSVRSLLDRYGVHHIDLMHVDIEGLDDMVLEQIDPSAPWAPRYVIFEIKHLSRDRYQRVRQRLTEGGYRTVNLWPDAFAYRTAPW